MAKYETPSDTQRNYHAAQLTFEANGDITWINPIAQEKWEEELKMHRETVDENDISKVVSMITGIPVNKIAKAELKELNNLDKRKNMMNSTNRKSMPKRLYQKYSQNTK